jgi:predicted RNA-binding protein (TIGR00451 family)
MVYVHGHEHCLAVGIAKMASPQIREIKEGIAVEVIHYVGDSFWNLLYRSKE